jgi:hypothetical protein
MNLGLPMSLPQRWLERNSQILLRVGVVLGVLLLSAYLAQRPSENYLIMLVGLGGVLILLRWPPLGLAALLVSTLVVPFSIGTGAQTPLTITVLIIPVLIGVWALDMFRRRRFELASSHTTLPLLGLALAATISLIAGGLPWNLFANTAPLRAQLGGWSVFVFSVAVFLLVANQITEVRWLEILVALFLSIGGIYIISRNVGPIGGLPAMMHTLGSDGSMFWVWIVALASGQLLFNRKLNPALRLGVALLVVAMLGYGFFLNRVWTSGWLPPMVAFGTILWLRNWRLGLVAASAGALILLVGRSDLLGSLVALKSYSIATRDVAREILLGQVFPLSPVLGLGPANYYWYTPLYPILGWYVSFNSHNNYVDILLQTGIVGLVCFFWIIWEVGLLGWSLRGRFADDFAEGYVYACLGGLAGTLASAWLADWLLPFAYNIGLNGFRASILAWLFLGGLVTLEQISLRKIKAEAHA